MQFIAKARYIQYSPYKLRPIVDVIRGKNARYALDWLATYPTQRVRPIEKVLRSAVANAKDMGNFDAVNLIIKDFRVDQGPMFRYFKPGAMGRPTVLRKRFSHLTCIVLKNNVREA
jgi:large subunit ribosomal protein L22